MNVEILSPSPAAKKRRSRLALDHVMPGDVITAESGFMRGHGTFVEDDKLIASVSGVVEKVNKLISVRPIRSRYQGEVGDVVVGRITEVAQKRWKVDINAKQEGILQLASIHLPGGVQRRRTQVDELHMREWFSENDLISAEVQSTFSDGSLAIHTRSLKYGKLTNGQFMNVPPALIKRSKNHFISLPCEVDVILGNNGYIWLTEATPHAQQNSDVMNDDVIHTAPLKMIGAESRERISRVRNSIAALAQLHLPIHYDSIMYTYKKSLSLPVKDMLKPENIVQITLSKQNIAEDMDEDMDSMLL